MLQLMRVRPEGSIWLVLAAWALALALPALPEPVQAQGSRAITNSTAGRDLTTASDETEVRRRARLRLELATAYYGRGQLTTALDEVKQAITLDPTFSEAFELRGLIYDGLNEPSFADESYRRAIQIDARNGSARHNYGWFLCRRQDYTRADAMFAQALDHPTSVSPARTLLARGVCQMQAGQTDEAKQSLSKSLELDPSNPATGFNLALLLYRAGDFERARFYIKRVNAVPEKINAESLWLAVRIEHKLGNRLERDDIGAQLKARFGSTREATLMELGRFDD